MYQIRIRINPILDGLVYAYCLWTCIIYMPSLIWCPIFFQFDNFIHYILNVLGLYYKHHYYCFNAARCVSSQLRYDSCDPGEWSCNWSNRTFGKKNRIWPHRLHDFHGDERQCNVFVAWLTWIDRIHNIKYELKACILAEHTYATHRHSMQCYEIKKLKKRTVLRMRD